MTYLGSDAARHNMFDLIIEAEADGRVQATP